MALLTFTVDEALAVLRANGLLPGAVRDMRGDGDGLKVIVSGGIVVRVRPESCAGGVLKLAIGSDSWAFKMADALGKVEEMIDEAIRDFPFVRREGKSLFIDLDEALQGRVKGLRVKEFALADGTVNIAF